MKVSPKDFKKLIAKWGTVELLSKEEDVWQCDICEAWVHEAHLHNDICSECYALDHDE